MLEADCLLDSDVLIWHLRGREKIARKVIELAGSGRLGISVITRAEILQGMRSGEEAQTLGLLSVCRSFPVDEVIADRAGELVGRFRRQGRTLHLADALIASTAIEHDLDLYTCNGRDYPYEDLRLRVLTPHSEVNEPQSDYG